MSQRGQLKGKRGFEMRRGWYRNVSCGTLTVCVQRTAPIQLGSIRVRGASMNEYLGALGAEPL